MAEALALVATPLVQKLIDHADSFCVKSYNEVYRVEDDIENLRSNLSRIEAVLKDAESCTKKSARLKDWLKKLRDASLDAEDVLETYAAEAALREINHLPLVDRILSRWIAARKIKKIVQRIISICDERSRMDFRSKNCSTKGTKNPSRMNFRENLPYRCSSEVIGRQEEKEEILMWLLSRESSTTLDCIPVVTITGMPGVGKTTLAQLVYNDERVFKKKDEDRRFKKAAWVHDSADFNDQKVFKKKDEDRRFKKAAWVHVSADFNVDKILKDIANMLTEVVHLVGPRHSILKSIADVLGGNPLLLVLDDVWVNDKLAWQELHGCLKTFPKGTKVLATGRDDRVVSLLGAINSHALPMLTEEHCWDLFRNEVDYYNDKSFRMEKKAIGKEIIKKCQFLPLAVKLMAGILRGGEIQCWRRTLNTDIWNAAESHDDEGLSNIMPTLFLSFDDLSPILKECFAYTSIFPKGHMFDKDELVKLWIAEGFIQHSAWTLEQLGGDYFDKLRSRSFFQFLKVDRKERFQMHDLMHDLAKHVSVNSQRVEDMNDSIHTTCRHVSFLCKDIDESTIDKLLPAQKLRTLLLPISSSRDFEHALEKMFKTLRYMRVLDLSSSSIIELPESIAELKLLHYLDLSRNAITLLPTGICKLLSLQILKLVGCTHLQGLPNDFGNLKDLRHLELDDMFWKCSKLPPRLGDLTNLRNLLRFNVYRQSGYKIEELKSMNSIEGLLHISNLENTYNAEAAQLSLKKGIDKLILEWSKGDMIPYDPMISELVLEDLQPHQDLQELQIEQYKGSRLSYWMQFGMFQKLYKISLNHCVNCTLLSLVHLPHLEVLHIKGMLELRGWSEDTSFPSLRTLTISDCPQLLCLPHKSLPQVHVVKIKGCNALQALPVMPFLMFLTLVNNKLLHNWGEVLPEVDNECLFEDGRYLQLSSYSRLLELEMVNCPMLIALPQSFAPQKLKIRECPLNALLDQQKSQQLQYLEVDSCHPRLIETIQMSPSLDELTISNIPFLPKLPNFPSLRSLYIHNCQQLQPSFLDGDKLGLLSSFTSLKFLSISECTIFPNNGLPTSIECLVIKKCSNLQSMHGRNNSYLTILSTLKDLCLEECPNLESLPEDGLPNSLQRLCIRRCPLLIEHCHEGGRYWDMISKVAHLELD